MNKDDLKKDDLSHEVQETEIIKNESENITDENSDKANDGSELNDSHDDNSKKNKKKKSKKELSNGIKALRLLLIIVVVLAGVIYMRGGFYFVKDKELSHEGQQTYEKSDEMVKDIMYEVMGLDEDLEPTKENLGSQVAPGGLAPYGFWVEEDYGVEGNEKGLQKRMESALPKFNEDYGGTLKIHLLKNEDYAKKFYNDFKLQTLGPVVDEYDFQNGQITFGQPMDKTGAFIVFRKGTVVYYVLALDNEKYKDANNLMDLLDIDFEFPAHEDLWKGALEKN